MPTIAEKRAAFRKLHEDGCFVLPNPWDVGSALYLQHLGFPALASTSAGFAFAQGRADNAVPRDEVLAHLAQLTSLNEQGGWALELQGMFLFTAIALLLMGPGRISINRR